MCAASHFPKCCTTLPKINVCVLGGVLLLECSLHRGFGFVTFTDPLVAQKVINMRDHTIRKSNLNVSFADPRGAGGVKPSQFPPDPFAIQMGYRHPVGGSPRYPFSGQQQPQAYTLSYGTPQHATPSAMVRTPSWS
jgi:RNA recognition motif-containing protein